MWRLRPKRASGDALALALDGRLAPSADVMFVRRSAFTVLLDVNHGQYYSLNETAITVWSALTDEVPFEDTLARMTREYDVSRVTLERDVTDLLKDLLAADLLIVRDGTVVNAT